MKISSKLKKNIANIITITRIIGTLVMMFTEVLSIPFYIAYIYSGLSDVLDGYLARKLHIESNLGRKLDSISDLLFYTTMMIKIWPYLVAYLPTYIWVMIWVTLGLRIIIYLYIGIRDKALLSNHTILNKATGTLLFGLPFFIKHKSFVVYSTIVASVAFIAALYEATLISKK